MMKMLMLKQKLKNRHLSKRVVLLLMSASVLLAAGGGLVTADQFDEQIKQLQQENSSNKKAADDLSAQASSYQDAVDKLASQINSIQQAIVATQKQSDELQVQIDANQAKLDQEKRVLGVNIKTMYLEGKISTLEILAASKDLSEFVDKEQYRSAVQDKVKTSVDKITALKQQLQKQQQQLQDYIKQQKAQQDQLAADEAKQSQMLAYTEGQKAAYDQLIKTNQAKISDLRSQQAAANARLFSGANLVLGTACDTAHGDTYPSPWCSAAQDSMIDYWGMFNRECVSYTAWKVSESGRYMPYWGGIGNANQWDDNARASGIPVDTSPRAGDVAIKNSGPYGHAMYVESVNANGTINISQYNASLDGRYSLAYNVSPAGLVFIHF
jgi:surface antigen